MTITKNMYVEAKKLVDTFGAKKISDLKNLPDFYTFKRGLIYSHRDFDVFLKALENKKKCAIVSGFNASGTIHIGHKIVFDTNLFFQREYGCDIFIPISDDESYICGKVKDQKQGLDYATKLARELLAYGFDPEKTFFIIDQLYTNIYNLAVKLSRGTTLNTIKATYGYDFEKNPGMFFYPAIQSAHILLPMEYFNYDNVLVPIGPDEDSHIRICRDLAARFKITKPSIVHSVFLPGLTGEKMSTTKPDSAIFLSDDEKSIRRKANKSLSGGRLTVEEHREFGGDVENDIACIYLQKLLLDEKESDELLEKYKKGELLSGEIKKVFGDKLVEFVNHFQIRLSKVTHEEIFNCLLKNKEVKKEDLIFE